MKINTVLLLLIATVVGVTDSNLKADGNTEQKTYSRAIMTDEELKSALERMGQRVSLREEIFRDLLDKKPQDQKSIDEARQRYYDAISKWSQTHALYSAPDYRPQPFFNRTVVDGKAHHLDYLSRGLIKTADARMNLTLQSKLDLIFSNVIPRVKELRPIIEQYDRQLDTYTHCQVEEVFSYPPSPITLLKSLRCLREHIPHSMFNSYNDRLAARALLEVDPTLTIVDTLYAHVYAYVKKRHKERGFWTRMYEKVRYGVNYFDYDK